MEKQFVEDVAREFERYAMQPDFGIIAGLVLLKDWVAQQIDSELDFMNGEQDGDEG